jgi:uncharacterized protein YuzE
MVIRYEKELDIMYIKLSEGNVAESDEEKPGLIFDYDESGNIMGIEILNASQKVNLPNGVQYEVA